MTDGMGCGINAGCPLPGMKAVCLLHRDGCLSLRRLTALSWSVLQFPVIEMCSQGAETSSGAVCLLVPLSASWTPSVCLPICLSIHPAKIDDVIVSLDDATKVRGKCLIGMSEAGDCYAGVIDSPRGPVNHRVTAGEELGGSWGGQGRKRRLPGSACFCRKATQ